MKDKKLIFMSTPMRSGSALTSRMLNAHSQVGMICDKLKYFTFCYDRYNPLTDDILIYYRKYFNILQKIK